MLKRVVIIVFLALLAIISVFVIILSKGKSLQEALATEAVPSNAIIYMDNIDYQYFTEDFIKSNQIWEAFSTHKSFDGLDSAFNSLNRIISSSLVLQERLKNDALSLSIHLQGNSSLGVIFYISLGEKISVNSIQTEVKSAINENTLINQLKYEAVDIYNVAIEGSASITSLTFAESKGLLIVSVSQMLVEDAIRSLNSNGGIHHQQGFRKVAETAGKYVFGNIYVNYSNLHQLFYPLIKTSKQKEISDHFEIAQWGEFDVDIRDDLILLNGMSYAVDSTKSWLNLFKGQSSVRLEATSFVPSNAIDFMSVGISNVKLFKENFMNELKVRDLYMGFVKSDKKMEKRIGVSPFSSLIDLINDEIALFTLEDNSTGKYNEVTILELRSRSEALELLTGWLTILADEKGKKLDDYITNYSLDEQSSYNIYTFPESLYDDGIVARFIKNNFTIYDNYLIFSSSKDALSRTIYQNVLHKTLENEPAHEEINSLISTKANLTIVLRPEYYIRRQKDFLNEATRKSLDEFSNTIKKIPGVVFQFANEGEIYYSNISLKYTSTVKEKALTVWESLLDSVAITKPYLVTNHYTSEKEIIIQDATNSLYLVNSTGRVLWKVKLDGPILSEIFQIDYYKNGKLQYIFNTAKGLHLIDRNGNYVERYPINLRADATNGIVMFDYDKRAEYRIFVACDDRKVYVYNIEGNIVPGWNFKKSEGIIHKPIQHFRVKDKDYIIISDQIRTYIVDRRGKERITLKETMLVSENNMFYIDMNISGDGPRFVTTNTDGNIVAFDLTGKVELILEHEASSNHYFRMEDLDQDGKPEYIYGDGNELEVIDLKDKRLFSYKLKSDISNLPDIYEFSSSDLKIGLTDSEKNLIYLLNTDGSLYEGFPLEGNTRFSIGYFAGSDSRFNLIVGSQNGFLYNYSIE